MDVPPHRLPHIRVLGEGDAVEVCLVQLEQGDSNVDVGQLKALICTNPSTEAVFSHILPSTIDLRTHPAQRLLRDDEHVGAGETVHMCGRKGVQPAKPVEQKSAVESRLEWANLAKFQRQEPQSSLPPMLSAPPPLVFGSPTKGQPLTEAEFEQKWARQDYAIFHLPNRRIIRYTITEQAETADVALSQICSEHGLRASEHRIQHAGGLLTVLWIFPGSEYLIKPK